MSNDTQKVSPKRLGKDDQELVRKATKPPTTSRTFHAEPILAIREEVRGGYVLKNFTV